MKQLQKTTMMDLMLFLCTGCTFSYIHRCAFVDLGWNIHHTFELFALFGTGLLLPTFSKISKIIVVLLGILFSWFVGYQHFLLTFCIGYLLPKENTHPLPKLGSWLAFILGLSVFSLSFFTIQIPLWSCWLLPTVLLLRHRSQPDAPPVTKEISPHFFGLLIGLLYTALWNHSSQFVQPTITDFEFGLTAFLIGHLSQQWINNLWMFEKFLKRFGSVFLLIWIFMGFASVQSWDGYSLLYGTILLSFLLGLGSSSSNWIGIMCGLFVHSIFSSEFNELWGLATASALWMIFSWPRMNGAAVGFGLTLFCLLTNRGPIVGTLPVSKFSYWPTEQLLTTSSSHWNQYGWFFMGRSPQMSKDVTIANRNHIVVENTRLTINNNTSDNETLFAELLQNLGTDVEQIAIFGDTTGRVNTAFEDMSEAQIQIAISNPTLTRLLSSLNTSRKDYWLKPNRQLTAHSRRQTITPPSADLIVEVIPHPWQSPISSGLSERHLHHLAKSITPNGTVGLIVHLQLIEDGGLSQICQRIEKVFPHLLYLLPKNNIDSLLILASNQAWTYQDFQTKLGKEDDGWIGQVLFRKWPLSTEDSISLTPQNQPFIPLVHLTKVKDFLPSAKELWPNISDGAASIVQEQLDTHKEYLHVLTAGIKGNLQQIQQNNLPSELTNSLVTPHIRSSQKAILKAQEDGQSSPHWEDAKRYALTAQMIAPENVEPWLLLGQIALGEGFLEVAEEKFTRAKELNPTSVEALSGLARVAGLQEDFHKMEQLLIEAKQIDMGNWIPYYNLATFYQEQEVPEKSLTLLQDALKLPNGDNEKTRIGLVEYYISQEKWTRALLEIDRLIQTSDNPTATMWYLRGRIHFGLELWEKAETDFRKATLADPQFHAARGSIGLIKIALGDLEGAAQAFRSTLRFDPNNEIARQNLQMVLQQLNTTPETTP